jgi:DNA-binding PadR family transcriptional regulator
MSSTRLLVLGVVRIFEPIHGYDVRRELLSWRVDQWANVAPSSIYNALKSLTRDGLLELVGTDQVRGRPERTTYRLTTEGGKEFEALLRSTLWTVREPLDPLMPAICFLPALPPEEIISALEHRISHIRGMLKQVEFVLAAPPTPTTPAHVQELHRLSTARLAAETDWASALIKRVRRSEIDRWGPAPGRTRPVRSRRGGARPGVKR